MVTITYSLRSHNTEGNPIPKEADWGVRERGFGRGLKILLCRKAQGVIHTLLDPAMRRSDPFQIGDRALPTRVTGVHSRYSNGHIFSSLTAGVMHNRAPLHHISICEPHWSRSESYKLYGRIANYPCHVLTISKLHEYSTDRLIYSRIQFVI